MSEMKNTAMENDPIEMAAKAAEDKLNDIFDTMIS